MLGFVPDQAAGMTVLCSFRSRSSVRCEPPVGSHTPMRSVRPYWKSWSPERGGHKNRHFTAHRALAHGEKSGCSHTIWKCLVKTLRLLVCSGRVRLLPRVLNVFCAIPHARRRGAHCSFMHLTSLTLSALNLVQYTANFWWIAFNQPWKNH